MTRRGRSAVAGILWALPVAALTLEGQVPLSLTALQRQTWLQILAAEDARVESVVQQEALRTIIRSNDQTLAALAVRALGRTENPDLCGDAVAALLSGVGPLRTAAARAAPSCYVKRPNTALFELLTRAAVAWVDPGETGAVATSIGRMTYHSTPDLRLAEEALIALAHRASTFDIPDPVVEGRAPDIATLLGVLTGLESLERRHGNMASPQPAVVDLAARVVRAGQTDGPRSGGGDQWALARRMALQILLTGRAVAGPVADLALTDADAQVRRLAAIAVARESPLREDAWMRASRDVAAVVRYAALEQLGRRSDAELEAYCDRVLNLARDEDPHVGLLALDLTGRCPADDRVISMLEGEVGQWIARPGADHGRPRWHRAAHAVVSLAAVAPGRAATPLSRLAADRSWHVRMYAARAAALARHREVLTHLGRDPNDNVREAAIAGLQKTAGHDADEVYLDALARSDYQLVMTAARALEATPRRADAGRALLAALDRITLEQRETSRDVRRALLERLGELDAPSDVDRLQAYTSDFDPVIAAAAASLLTRWTGRPHVPAPRPLPRLPLPTPQQLLDLLDTRVILHMRALGTIELQLLATDAPLNAFRFARLAARGYYDGLTFHRVAPGFVIQGGSPGANEYMGDGPFTRDEVGAPNRRGTVGLSTRGRDTGDAQFYVNLVDNHRLDEDYTVFAVVVRGMEIVDGILEGDVIERAVVTRH